MVRRNQTDQNPRFEQTTPLPAAVLWIWAASLLLGLVSVVPFVFMRYFLFVPIFSACVISLLVIFSTRMLWLNHTVLLTIVISAIASAILWIRPLVTAARSTEVERQLAVFGVEISQTVIAVLIMVFLFVLALGREGARVSGLPFLIGGILMAIWVFAGITGFISDCRIIADDSRLASCLWFDWSMPAALASLGLVIVATLRPPIGITRGERTLFHVAALWALTGAESAIVCWWFYVISFM